MVMHRIGVDLGPADAAASIDARVAAAAAAGARWVRLRFALDARRAVDDAFVGAAQAAVATAGAARLRVLGVIDGGLTVAPDALAADAATAPAIAAAVADELVEHGGRLAAALGAGVAAWEILPAPNAALGRRGPIAPERWAALLNAVGPAVREAAPAATIVAGGLLSTADDDGVDFVRAAVEAGRWAVMTPPFDGLGLQLRLLSAGGADEAEVAAAIAERTGRLWRAAAAALGRHAPDVRGLWVTGVSWDAEQTGDAAQARNLWTAFDTLTADPAVQAVVWTALADDGAANGLFSAADLDGASARPAWKAFNDFAQYARQISPPPVVLVAPDGAAADDALPAADGVAVDGAAAGDETVAGDGIAVVDEAAAPLAAAPPAAAAIRFRVPSLPELLAAAGVAPADLPAALDAVAARHGRRDALPPGDYEVPWASAGAAAPAAASSMASMASPSTSPVAWQSPAAPSPAAPAAAPGAAAGDLTNQQVLTAFYRAGGGSWALLQRAGLDLADLVSQRDASFGGPSIAQMEGLSPSERAAVLGELGGGS